MADAPAAAVYFPFHLSWLALHERARSGGRGRTVVITPPPGGVGSAAVQSPTAAGARVIATAGSRQSTSSAGPSAHPDHQLPRHRLRAGGPRRGHRRARRRRGVRLDRRRRDNQDVPVHGVQRPPPSGRIRVGHRSRRRGDRPAARPVRQLLPLRRVPRLRRRSSAPQGSDAATTSRRTPTGSGCTPDPRPRLERATCDPSSAARSPSRTCPGALQAMADRKTLGRTVALVG